MAVVNFPITDLNKLVGTTLTKKHIEDIIPMIGCAFEGSTKDEVSFDIFPDRPDMLSIEGFARTVRSFIGKKNKKISVTKGKNSLKIDDNVRTIRPYIQCALVKNVEMTDDLVAAIMQIQEKLTDTIGRRRKKMAIGIHDASQLKFPFIYKAVDSSLSFVPLDFKKDMTISEILKNHPKGKKYGKIISGRKYPIIVDNDNKVLSFPPVINSDLTRVSKKSKTLFLDVTGTDEKAVRIALNILTMMFFERGAKVETIKINGKYYPDISYSKTKLNLDYARRLIGLDLKETEIKKSLDKMGLEYSGKNVTIPPYRNDIMHPIDIVEDVAIGYGYMNFNPDIPKIATEARRLNKTEMSTTVKEIMIGLGYQEVLTNVLTTPENEFNKMNIKSVPTPETSNAVSDDNGICRRNLIPSLMNVLSQNKHREYPQRIFEVGDCVVLDKNDLGSATKRKIGIAIIGDYGYENLASDIDALLRSLGLKFSLGKSSHKSFIDGRIAKIKSSGKVIGAIGEIHPEVLNKWGLEFPVVTAEIDFNSISN